LPRGRTARLSGVAGDFANRRDQRRSDCGERSVASRTVSVKVKS